MTDNLSVSLLPMTLEWGRKENNLARFQDLLDRVPPASDLIVVPETFSTGFPAGMERNLVAALAEPADGPLIQFLKDIAAERNFAVAGSFICSENGRLSNRAFFIRPDGTADFSDKRHLFTMGGEDKVFSRGSERMAVEFRGWKISLAVCYDLRFPVWLRNDPANPYDLLVVVANWPMVRRDAWQKLLYARAIENLAYVAGVDCKGSDPTGHDYDGTSLIIDFMGHNLTLSQPENSDRDECLSAVLSKERLKKFRLRFPAHLDADPFLLL